MHNRLYRISFWLIILIFIAAFCSSPIFSQAKPSAKPLRILFVGNSLTFYYEMPKVLAILGNAPGLQPPLFTQIYAPGGFTLEQNFKQGNALDIIRKGKWDYVVLQEGSAQTITDREKFIEYSRKFDSEIKKAGAKTIFYMTWAYQKSDPNMFSQVAQAYKKMAADVNAPVAPVGLAWQRALKENPKILLYDKDGVHPNSAGAYLTACVFYITLTGKSPEGLSNGGLKELKRQDCLALQKIAWKTIVESEDKKTYITELAKEKSLILKRPDDEASTISKAAETESVSKPVEIPIKDYMIGADISWVQSAEDRGVRFSDNGVQKDILEILKVHGFNYIRLRLFVDPTKATPRDRPYSMRGYCDLPHTITMAKRVKTAGMGLFIDFHYSDSWADPNKQFTPSAWANLEFDELVNKTHDYTKDAIEQLKSAGAIPDMVQIGNEITLGIMIDHGGSTKNWEQLGELLKAGIAGVREVNPKILIALHIDKGGDNAATRQWVDAALAQGVDFNVLAQSCYTRWHGQPSDWKANFEDLVTRYPSLSFVIAEFAAEIVEANEIMLNLPNRRGLGTFIWEPTANNNRQALFNNRGEVIQERMDLYEQVIRKFKQINIK